MFEFILISGLLTIGAVVLGVVLLIGFVLKLMFKLVLLPFTLLGGLLKLLILLPLVIIGLVVAPVLFTVLALLALPFLLIAGLFGLGWAAVAA